MPIVPTNMLKASSGEVRGQGLDGRWGGKEHVSERKFIDDEMAEEELIVPDLKVEDIKAENRDHGSQSSVGAKAVT